MTNITFDPSIKISYGGPRGMTPTITNERGDIVDELYILAHYQIATRGWYETIDTLAAAQDRIEELERLLDLRDNDQTEADFLAGTGRM